MPDYSKLSDDELMAMLAPTRSSIAMDALKSAGTGAAEGGIGIAGMPGDVIALAEKAAGSRQATPAPDAVGKVPSQSAPILPTSAQIKSAIEDRTGRFYQPQTEAGDAARTVASFWPAALPAGGPLARTARVLMSGLASEGAGQATKGTAIEPYARAAAALVATPSVAGRAVTPFAASPERARLLQTLANEGVDSLTAGQRTGNKTLQYAESVLGDAAGAGGRATRVQQEGQRQFTEAAMRRAGTGPNATPEVLSNNQTRLGQQFQDLSARNTLQFDPQFVRDAAQSVRDYQRVPPSQQRAIVEGYVNDIADHMTAGGMPGTYYQEMRSRLSRQSKGVRNSDPTLSEALRGLRNALDDAMGRSISPADSEAWNLARQQYGAQKVLEKSASRAGEATAEGQIVPANLRNTVAAENRGAYARGEGDFSELARAGSGVMAPLPNSGTGPRTAIQGMATLLGGGAGMMSGGSEAGLGALAGAASPAVIGRILMSRPVQGYLGNQALAPVLQNTTPGRDALMQLLLSEQGSKLQAR